MSGHGQRQSSSVPVIRCDGLYKIFGPNANNMLKQVNGKVDALAFKKLVA